MIINYDIYESLRDKMTPKSEEDITMSMKDVPFYRKGKIYNNLCRKSNGKVPDRVLQCLPLIAKCHQEVLFNSEIDVYPYLKEVWKYTNYKKQTDPEDIIKLSFEMTVKKNSKRFFISQHHNLGYLQCSFNNPNTGKRDITTIKSVREFMNLINNMGLLNESVRDKMTPISRDKIKELIDEIEDPYPKLTKILSLNYPMSDEELKLYVEQLVPWQKVSIAVTYDLVWVLKDAIEDGANIHDQDEQPLLVAIMKCSFEVMKELFKLGAKLSTYSVKPAIDRLMTTQDENDLIKLFGILINNGLDIHYMDEYFLRTAIELRKLKLVEYLIKHGASLDTRSIRFIMKHMDKNDEKDIDMINLIEKYSE